MPIRPPSGVPGSRWLAGTLLHRLPDDARDELLRLGNEVHFLPGEQILTQGGRRTAVYLLLRGRKSMTACVKVTAATDSGIEALLGIRVTGDVVGEMAALREHPIRSATVTTCSETRAIKISHHDFRAFLNRRTDCWEALSSMITARLDWADRRRLDFAGYDVRTRLARVITELADRHGYETSQGYELGVQLSQEELGMLVGASKAAASKAMRELKKRRLVTCEYRHVVILNRVTLSKEADLEP